METRAALAKRHDTLRIERIDEAAARGQTATARLSALEAVLVQTAQAEPRLRAITDAATASIVHVVYEAGL